MSQPPREEDGGAVVGFPKEGSLNGYLLVHSDGIDTPIRTL
jgi:hypothetical protein